MIKSRLNLRNVAIACLAATVIFASCKKDTPDLNGSVTISPTANVFVGDELTATYSGKETVTWQWKKDGAAIGSATSDKYTPTEAGSYTATASAAGFNSKTNATAVEVKNLQNLNGTVSISPNADVYAGEELTAAYNGSETVTITWQWYKGGTAIDGETDNKYKPADEGSYSVTASAKGYNSKPSAGVEVLMPIVFGVQTYDWNNEPIKGKTMVFEMIVDYLNEGKSSISSFIPGSFIKIENGLLYITLKKPNTIYPFNILSKNVYPFGSMGGMEEVNGNNLNANVFILHNRIYNEEEWDIWHRNDVHDVTFLIYTEKDVLITGTRAQGDVYWVMNINLDLKKGWNWTIMKHNPSIWTAYWNTEIPDASYKWYLDEPE